MADYPQDLDYEKDVLKFKQIWNDIKKPTKADLQTIQEKPQKIQHKKSVPKSAKPPKKQPSKKVTVISEAKIQRNPKDDPEQIIQVVTKPASTFQDKLRNQKNNEIKQCLIFDNTMAPTNNQVADLKRTVDERNYQLSMLRTSNSRNQDKIRYLQREIQKRDQVIESLKARERQLIAQTSSLNSKQFNFNYGKVQYENFKNDTRRLLKMLQNTSQYSYFASFGLDDDGVRFLNEVNKTVKTKIDRPNVTNFHFCNCNKQFISESGLWVPDKVYSFAKKFMKDKNDQITHAQLQLLLYELNKIWRQRQKRIINTVNASKAHQVDKFKRKIKNMERQKSKGSLD